MLISSGNNKTSRQAKRFRPFEAQNETGRVESTLKRHLPLHKKERLAPFLPLLASMTQTKTQKALNKITHSYQRSRK
ncbi:MAG: hypothetical protein CL932_12095 [Deltaproteobacteria bacterium]|nr:hypothetical protein [Deltaproteobacteria bacterium]